MTHRNGTHTSKLVFLSRIGGSIGPKLCLTLYMQNIWVTCVSTCDCMCVCLCVATFGGDADNVDIASHRSTGREELFAQDDGLDPNLEPAGGEAETRSI